MSPNAGGVVCLENVLAGYLPAGRGEAVVITGGSGTGKTTAATQLRETLGDRFRGQILDEPSAKELAEALTDGPVIYFARRPMRDQHLARFDLAGWGDDELIEYLRAVEPSKCGAVMRRASELQDRDAIRGNPELWVEILRRFLADRDVTGLADLLIVGQRSPREVARLMEAALACTADRPSADSQQVARYWRRLTPDERRILRHRPVFEALAARRIVERLSSGEPGDFLAMEFSPELLRACGQLLKSAGEARTTLSEVMHHDQKAWHPAAASLLVASGIGWSPSVGCVPRLSGAHLAGVCWPEVELQGVSAFEANFSRANLRRAGLEGALLRGACFAQADLSQAHLARAVLECADLSGADLTSADLENAYLTQAILARTNLSGAYAPRALLVRADLREARLIRVMLAGCEMYQTDVRDADFSGADLSQADIQSVRLNAAELRGARFADAVLSECRLNGVEMPAADFSGARLTNVDLTASHMPNADFSDASFSGVGLGEIKWPNCNLRDADLRGVTFHMGSSRSGLLIGAPVSEGTRTGFYTDESGERTFRSPEDIRKANLCCADLRGAQIQGVDFYLVDLRGAKLDGWQLEWVRKCGAIVK